MEEGTKIAGTIDSVTVNLYPHNPDDDREDYEVSDTLLPGVCLVLRGVSVEGMDCSTLTDGKYEIPLCYGVEAIKPFVDGDFQTSRKVVLGESAVGLSAAWDMPLDNPQRHLVNE